MIGKWIGRLLVASLFLWSVSYGYTVKLLNSENSPLPSAAVWDILFDVKGRLWLGTGKGVYVFDGSEWKVYNSKNTDKKLFKDSVVKVFQDSKGRFWFATRSSFIGGGGVTLYDGKSWRLFRTQNSGLPSNFVWDIVEDARGRLWFATDKGVVVYDGNNWKVYNKANTALGLPGDSVWDIFRDSEGNLWFATDKGVGWFNGREWRNMTKSNAPLDNDNVSCVFVDSTGRLWFGTRSGYITKGGVVMYDGKDFHFFHKSDGLPHNDVNVIYEDKKGNIWVGTRGGLARFAGKAFETVLDGYRVWDMAERKGEFYIATSRGLVILKEGSR